MARRLATASTGGSRQVRLSPQIGRYEIQAELGRGGFGQVFRAFDPTVGRLVAIKTLTVGSDLDLLKRFKNEAAAAGRLQHPNIVIIYDFGDDRGTPYLVMELLDGEDLDRVIHSRRPLGLLQKLDIIGQAAAGLHHAHRKGIVHRDVKPANIMLQNDNVVKIMDFGIALLTQAAATRITPTGSMIGTPLYMAPEQLTGANSDTLTDIFAFGITCYKLITGIHPFEAETLEGLRYNILNREPEPIRVLNPECPEALEHAVLRMLAKDREQRCPSLEDIRFDLEPVALDLKKEHVTDLLREARVLIAAKQWESAQAKVMEALESDPGNRAARDLRETLQRQIREEEIRPRVWALASEGREDLRARRYQEAIAKFQSAQLLSKSNSELQKLLDEAKASWESARAAGRIFQTAEASFQQGDLTAARAQLNQALLKDPEHPGGEALRDSIEQSIKARHRARLLEEGLNTVRRLVVLENFDEAIERIEALCRDFPESAMAADLLRSSQRERENRIRQSQLQMALAAARALVKAEQFSEAVKRLAEWCGEFPESAELRDLASFASDELRLQQQTVAVNAAMADGRMLMEQQQFQAAVERLRRALAEYPAANALRDLIQTVEASKSASERRTALDEATKQASALIGEERFAEALESIGAFSRAYGDSPELEPPRKSAEEGLEAQRRQHAARRVVMDARTLLEDNKADSASEMLAAGTLQFPDDPEMRSLFAEAKERLERQLRENKASAIIAEAESLARAREFDQALSTLDQGLLDFPAQDRLIRCRQATLAVKARFDRVIGYGRAVETIRALLQAGRLEEGLGRADAAIAEFGRDPTFDDLKAQLAVALEARAQAAEAQQLSQEARELLDRGELAAAMQIIDAAWPRFAGHEALAKLKAAADAQSRIRQRAVEVEAHLREVRRDFDSGRFDVALASVEAGIQRWGNEEQFLRLREEILEEKRDAERQRTLEGLKKTLRRLEASGQFERALEMLADRLPNFGPDPELMALQAALETGSEAQRVKRAAATLSQEAGRLLGQDLAAEACRLLEAAPELHGDERVARVMAAARQRVEEEDRELASAGVESRVQALLDQGAPAEALREVDQALAVDSESKRLSKLRLRVQSEQEAAEVARLVRDADEAGDLDQALALVRSGLLKHPASGTLSELQSRVERRLEERRHAAALERGISEAEAILSRNDPAAALAVLRPLARKYSGQKRLLELLESAEAELNQLERERDLALVKEQAEQLIRQQKYAEALALINARFPGEARFRELAAGAEAQLGQRRRQEALERAWNRLLAIEQRVPLTARSKLQRLQVEIRQACAGCEEDANLVRLVARVEHQINEALNAPPPPSRPVPWRRIGVGTVVVAGLAALTMVPRLLEEPPLVPFEIRTDPTGALVSAGGLSCTTPDCRLKLLPGQYQVEARLKGFLSTRQELTLEAHRPPGVTTLTLTPEPLLVVEKPPAPNETPRARLLVSTGVPEASVVLNGLLVGRSDVKGEFRWPVAAGSYEVRVEKSGYASAAPQRAMVRKNDAPVSLTFRLAVLPPAATSGKTVEAAKVAKTAEELKAMDEFLKSPTDPPVSPTAPKPTLEAREAQAWESTKNSQDPAQWEAFLRDHPSGAHSAAASAKLDELLWAAVNQSDAKARAYLTRFPRGAHAPEAHGLVDGLAAWNRVDKNNAQALQTFIDLNPPNRHKPEAQSQLAAVNREKQRQKQSELLAAERPGIQTALDKFKQAFLKKNAKDLKTIWPGATQAWLESINRKGATMFAELKDCSDWEVDGDKALTLCRLNTSTTIAGVPQEPKSNREKVILRKSAGQWRIETIRAE